MWLHAHSPSNRGKLRAMIRADHIVAVQES